MTTAASAPSRWQDWLPPVGARLFYVVIFALLAFLVLYPGAQLVITSLQDGRPGEDAA